jgi:hypothetical protein
LDVEVEMPDELDLAALKKAAPGLQGGEEAMPITNEAGHSSWNLVAVVITVPYFRLLLLRPTHRSSFLMPPLSLS